MKMKSAWHLEIENGCEQDQGLREPKRRAGNLLQSMSNPNSGYHRSNLLHDGIVFAHTTQTAASSPE